MMNFKSRFATRLICGLVLGASAFSAQADNYEDGLMAFAVGNFQEAGRLFMNSADEGNAGAEHMLMRLFSEGKLYSSSLDNDTLKWTRKAAERGIAQAQFALGELYIKRDDAKSAVTWYRKAIVQGHPGAYYKLGQLLEKGAAGLSADRNESRHLFSIAASEFDVHAQKGDATAQNTLASMYEKGQGMNKNIKMAAKWYDAAARQGYALAQLNLGRLYASGNGVPRSTYQAAYWLDLAAAQGLREAQILLSEIKRSGKDSVALAM